MRLTFSSDYDWIDRQTDKLRKVIFKNFTDVSFQKIQVKLEQ